MAEVKSAVEREYTIPLRSEWTKVSRYKRTGKSVKAIKEFIAKHMKIADRDTNKVKLDVYLNNELWFRGAKKPPIKIKVRAIKEGDLVRVEMVDVPDHVKFHKVKVEKFHKKSDKKPEEKKSEKKEEKAGERTEKEKTEEKEKGKAEEVMHEKAANQEAKQMKHTVGKGKDPQIHRKALKK